MYRERGFVLKDMYLIKIQIDYSAHIMKLFNNDLPLLRMEILFNMAESIQISEMES